MTHKHTHGTRSVGLLVVCVCVWRVYCFASSSLSLHALFSLSRSNTNNTQTQQRQQHWTVPGSSLRSFSAENRTPSGDLAPKSRHLNSLPRSISVPRRIQQGQNHRGVVWFTWQDWNAKLINLFVIVAMVSSQVVKVKRDTLRPCMTCPLCHNFYKDATTISLCLHTCSSLLPFDFCALSDFYAALEKIYPDSDVAPVYLPRNLQCIALCLIPLGSYSSLSLLSNLYLIGWIFMIWVFNALA